MILLLILIFFYNSKLYFKNIESFDVNSKISVILLNYDRPHNLHKTLPVLNKNELISEILVVHGHPDHFFNFKQDKVINIKDYKNNKLYGGARRFFHIDKCKNDIILFLDDDVLPSKELIENLYTELNKDYSKNTFYGCVKRICNLSGYYTSTENSNVILTPILLIKKELMKNYINNKEGFIKYKKWLFDYKGNCEDLSLNMFIRKVQKEDPIYVEGHYDTLDNKGGYHNKPDHYKTRSDFCKKFG